MRGRRSGSAAAWGCPVQGNRTFEELIRTLPQALERETRLHALARRRRHRRSPLRIAEELLDRIRVPFCLFGLSGALDQNAALLGDELRLTTDACADDRGAGCHGLVQASAIPSEREGRKRTSAAAIKGAISSLDTAPSIRTPLLNPSFRRACSSHRRSGPSPAITAVKRMLRSRSRANMAASTLGCLSSEIRPTKSTIGSSGGNLESTTNRDPRVRHWSKCMDVDVCVTNLDTRFVPHPARPSSVGGAARRSA